MRDLQNKKTDISTGISTSCTPFSLIIPAYNEQDGIGAVLDELETVVRESDLECEIIVVDDGSVDNTVAEVEKYDVELIRHPANRGYGAALKTGIRKAKHDWIVITDADGTYPNDRIRDLLTASSVSDMVVGARVGTEVKIPLIRKPAKWFITRLASYLADFEIPDLNSGMRVMKKTVIEQFINILPSGFSFTTTITLAMLTNDFVVSYIPINYSTRVGKSKIRPIRDTLKFIQLIVRTVMYFNPLKVFVPISVLLFAMSASVLLYSYFRTPEIMDITTIVLFVSGVQMIGIGMIADLVDKRSK